MDQIRTFITDKQTLEDLNLLGAYRPGSVYSIFNRLKTRGGGHLMQSWFQHPLQDATDINRRSMLFKSFGDLGLSFPVGPEEFAAAESYLRSASKGNRLTMAAGIAIQKMKATFVHDGQFGQLQDGLQTAIAFLKGYSSFMRKLSRHVGPEHPYWEDLEQVCKFFADNRMGWVEEVAPKCTFTFTELCRYDYLLRNRLRQEIDALLESAYRLDIYISVSRVANERGFGYAEALGAAAGCFETSGLWHPGLKDGVRNKLAFQSKSNMIFLTGANMAGKSTLMKAFGITVYLAHMGFPVPAQDLRFSLMQGLYSSINVSDDLQSGYSHFYSEVMRVKTIALQVAKGLRLVVLFDELFKGTNVKDAFEATLEVTKGFAGYGRCFFIISTHIIEVGERLLETRQLRAVYLPTVMDGNSPRYTYQLQPGITSDRQGMMIIENEGILALFNKDAANARTG